MNKAIAVYKVRRGHEWVAQLARGGRHKDVRRPTRATAKVRLRKELKA